jgi:hypothetical protein
MSFFAAITIYCDAPLCRRAELVLVHAGPTFGSDSDESIPLPDGWVEYLWEDKDAAAACGDCPHRRHFCAKHDTDDVRARHLTNTGGKSLSFSRAAFPGNDPGDPGESLQRHRSPCFCNDCRARIGLPKMVP